MRGCEKEHQANLLTNKLVGKKDATVTVARTPGEGKEGIEISRLFV